GSDAQDDPRLLPDIANGYHQLAIAQGKPSVANLGDFTGALASARKARAAFDRLLTIRPGDYETACNKGDLIFDIALIQQRVAGEDPNATRREGIQYWEELARRHPDRERALRGLAVALFYK